jgi:hypothetical protein
MRRGIAAIIDTVSSVEAELQAGRAGLTIRRVDPLLGH